LIKLVEAVNKGEEGEASSCGDGRGLRMRVGEIERGFDSGITGEPVSGLSRRIGSAAQAVRGRKVFEILLVVVIAGDKQEETEN
jgi:hypothetical protein